MRAMRWNRWKSLGLVATVALAACGGGDGDAPEEVRAQDGRSFSPANPSATTFEALAAAPGDAVDNASTSRWAGVLEGAAYRIEVPARWNGRLVMYAHGYAGEGNALNVTNPSIRRHLIQNGYAWAASSYSKNYYDVRAGVEDTNALALAFNRLAAARGRPLANRSACTSPAIPWAAMSRRRPSRPRPWPRPGTRCATRAPCPCAA